MTFEDRFKELETVLAKLEGGELTLAESLQEYELGVRALAGCREALTKAEQRIEELTPAERGGE